MYIIDPDRFQRALKERGYRSIAEFAKGIGVHRNSIHYYLSGHSVFPEVLERIINALGLKPDDIIVKKENGTSPIEDIAPVIEQLHREFPDVAFVLFGSRAKGTSKKYSDWDIGVYKSGGLPHVVYRSIVRKKNDLAEDLPFFIEIVNFNNADEDFLKEASVGWTFLTGSIKSFLELKRKAAL